jgi:hypothetical protein
MKQLTLATALVVLFPVAGAAAAGLSGTWMSGGGGQTFVFKVHGDWFTGLVCGPCDDPSSVFKIDEGRMLDSDRLAFTIAYDTGGPDFKRVGPYRAHVTATLAGNQLTMVAQHAAGRGTGVTTVLKRVVDGYAGVNPESVVATVPSLSREASKPSPIEGKWVAAGRNAQQNFILKVRDNRIWGLVCGPCNPDGVFLIDDGTFDGSNVTFYINHLDTPPSARKSGISRNIMRGTLSGNVMKFKWVREGAEDQPGGEMTLVGPIR